MTGKGTLIRQNEEHKRKFFRMLQQLKDQQTTIDKLVDFLSDTAEELSGCNYRGDIVENIRDLINSVTEKK